MLQVNIPYGFVISAVEIKTKLKQKGIQRAYDVKRKYGQYFLVKCGSEEFFDAVPAEYTTQVMHQALVLNVDYVLFVVATNRGIVYEVRISLLAVSIRCNS